MEIEKEREREHQSEANLIPLIRIKRHSHIIIIPPCNCNKIYKENEYINKEFFVSFIIT